MNQVVLNKETAFAVAKLIAPLVCSLAATFGWSLDANLVFNIVISIFAVVLFVYAWWANNNVTEAAQLSQQVLEGLKDEDVAEKDITKLVEAAESE